MERHPTYTIRVAEQDAQDLADALRKPLNPESGDAGMGENFCPADATDLTPLSEVEAAATDVVLERWMTVSVHPQRVERFEAIVDGINGASLARYHPEGKTDSAHEEPPAFREAGEHPAADGLERRPEEANV